MRPFMTSLFSRSRLLAAVAIALAASLSGASRADAAASGLTRKDRAAIESYLRSQAAGAPGDITVQVLDPVSSALPPCPGLQPFLPRGVSAWGRFSVGVRCPGERPWTRFLPAQVGVEGTYLVAAHPIRAGQTVDERDLAEHRGDLTKLPRTVLTHAPQVAGMVAVNAIAAETPLRSDLLRGALVIQRGQIVRLMAEGDGFVASTEGTAMTSAATGAVLQVRTATGRVLSAVARADGTANVRN